MKLIKKTATYLLCAILFLAPMTSCIGGIPPAQGQAAITEIKTQVKEGSLSKELGDLLIQRIMARMDPNYSGEIDWDQIMVVGGGILSAVIASVTGVRLARGPAKPLDGSQASLLKDLLARHKMKILDEEWAEDGAEDEADKT